MEVAKVTDGAYPQQIPSGVRTSADVGLTLSEPEDSDSFCINGQILNDSDIRWYYESGSGLKEGACSGEVIPLSEHGMPKNLVTDTSFSNVSASGWWINLQNKPGTTVSVRPGTEDDPFPDKPVLVITNTVARSTAWAVLQSRGVALDQVKAGKSYSRSYYVRKTGSVFTGPVSVPGLVDSNAQNRTLHNSPSTMVTNSWRKVSGTGTALKDATPLNELYVSITTGEFNKANWTLEFQGFEMYEQ